METINNTDEKLYITFQTEEEILKFVEVCCRYDDAIDVKVDKMTTDAKSVLGMLLMNKNQPLEIEYVCYDNENNYSQFRAEMIEKFNIKVVGIIPKTMI